MLVYRNDNGWRVFCIEGSRILRVCKAWLEGHSIKQQSRIFDSMLRHFLGFVYTLI